MAEKIRSLIIDDEPPARDLLRHYLGAINEIAIVGECVNGFDAIKAIREFAPQLIFLDIQMPRINGFEMLELIEKKPEVIFCTAYDEYAIKAFEMHAVDYLLKPFSEERLREAVERALARIHRHEAISQNIYEKVASSFAKPGRSLERIVAKTGTKITVISVDTIHYLEAQDDYVLVVSDQGSHLKEKTLKYYSTHLPDNKFIRVHRSFIVNIGQIKSVSLYGKESYRIKLQSGEEIKASASGYRLLKSLL